MSTNFKVEFVKPKKRVLIPTLFLVIGLPLLTLYLLLKPSGTSEISASTAPSVTSGPTVVPPATSDGTLVPVKIPDISKLPVVTETHLAEPEPAVTEGTVTVVEEPSPEPIADQSVQALPEEDQSVQALPEDDQAVQAIPEEQTPAPTVNTLPTTEPIETSDTSPVTNGTSYQLIGGGPAVTLGTYSGAGSVAVTVTKNVGSGAPNVPTYISVTCDGTAQPGITFNLVGETPVTKTVLFSGSDCRVFARIAQPSGNYANTYNTATALVGQPVYQGGTPTSVNAGWVSAPVPSSANFTLPVPAGAFGSVNLKLTACSSQGGTSDATVTNGCGTLVQSGLGSQGTVSLSDSTGPLGSASFDISAQTHHDTLAIPLTRATSGPITITVTKTSGSAVLVHGPGSGFSGTR